ncbi:MAG: hypothetical protein JXA71_17225 [Chitinispirillaceae bacterium]|nr:hypothetical protein [Chitinispirillaceae bacterium]
MEQAGLGTRIISIDKNGKSTVKNAISSDKRIGEIQLIKENDSHICNLCRNKIDVDLSEDHVPPQCMGNEGRFYYINYLNFCTKLDSYYGLFQGGIKYKTICTKCNSDTLSCFDNEIASFVSLLKDKMKGSDPIIRIDCNPHLILKGMIGHCLSTSLTDSPSTLELQMLAYFWGNQKFEDRIRVYIMPYYDENMISILREIGWVSIRNQKMVFSCIKCFPFGFFIIFEGDLIGTPNWNKFLYDDRQQSVEIDLRWRFEKWFPELYYPKDSGMLLGHTAAHSILGFRHKEDLPNEVRIG